MLCRGGERVGLRVRACLCESRCCWDPAGADSLVGRALRQKWLCSRPCFEFSRARAAPPVRSCDVRANYRIALIWSERLRAHKLGCAHWGGWVSAKWIAEYRERGGRGSVGLEQIAPRTHLQTRRRSWNYSRGRGRRPASSRRAVRATLQSPDTRVARRGQQVERRGVDGCGAGAAAALCM